MKKLALPLVVALLAGTACWPFARDQELSPMSVERASGAGVIEVLRGNEVIPVGQDEVAIRAQDVIRTAGDAEARIRLAGSRESLLGSAGRVVVLGTAALELAAGSLVARAGSPTRLAMGDVALDAGDDAVVRLDRGFASARAGVYRGTATAMAPGEDRLTLARLFQASTTAGDLPPTPSPYRVDPADPYDRIYLEDVIALDERLERLRAGFQSQVGGRRPGLGYFRRLAGGEPVGFLRPYLKERIPAADLLIGFTVARTAAGDLESQTERAFDLYERGARWGVAAAIMRVPQRPLLAELTRAITATGVVAQGTGGEPVFLAEGGGGELGGPAPAPGPGGGGNGDGGDDGGNDPEPRPTASPTCDNEITCTIEDIIGPQPTPTPTSNIVDELLGGDD